MGQASCRDSYRLMTTKYWHKCEVALTLVEELFIGVWKGSGVS
jgi:hypothetical protein